MRGEKECFTITMEEKGKTNRDKSPSGRCRNAMYVWSDQDSFVNAKWSVSLTSTAVLYLINWASTICYLLCFLFLQIEELCSYVRIAFEKRQRKGYLISLFSVCLSLMTLFKLCYHLKPNFTKL